MKNNMEPQALRFKADNLLAANDFKGANELLSKLSQIVPEDPEIWYRLGWTSSQLGDAQAAVRQYQKTLSLAPEWIHAHYNLAMVLGQSGAMTQAHRHLQQVVRLDPNHVDAKIKLAFIEYERGNIPDALSQLNGAKRIAPAHAGVHLQLGLIYIAQGELIRAEKCFMTTLREEPGNKEALTQLATVKAYGGNPQKAYQIIAPLLYPETAYVSAAILLANFCRPLGRCQEAMELLNVLLSGQITVEYERKIHFALGNLHEREGNYKKAFWHFAQGNKLCDISFDPWEQKRWIKSVKQQLNREFFTLAAHAKNLSKRIRPVFILGMPRSGTSLVEQILSSHPEIHGAGERMEIANIAKTICSDVGVRQPYPVCLSEVDQGQLSTVAKRYIKDISMKAPGSTRIITDKMPGNYQHLGLIQLLFPKARVIHCVRDPMDTCLSCYTNRLMGHAYSYNLTNLGRYYRLYEELMDHWKNTLSLSIMDVHYEDLVEAPERVSREIVKFCGLKWDNSCLDFHRSKRNVVTTSTDQVRQPIYRKSVKRWKNYEEDLGELREALDKRI